MTVDPPSNKGMLALDRSAFKVDAQCLGLRIPASASNDFMIAFKDILLNLRRYKVIIDDPEGDRAKRVILLNLSMKNEDLEALPESMKVAIASAQATAIPHKITLDYDYWSCDQVLKAILPDGLIPPSSFELVGHIAHLNLRDEYLPYKAIIGQVLIDKNRFIRTVVNKLDSIDHTFRFFKMEVLAGDDDFMATQNENSCRFKFDFSKVYWNSRLQKEHERLIAMFKEGEFVADVFAGVGPFAVPAAKKGVFVIANDLNPESYKWLSHNAHLNKVEDHLLCHKMDGRDFIRQSLSLLHSEQTLSDLKEKAVSYTSERASKRRRVKKDGNNAEPIEPIIATIEVPPYYHHYVMNLPATAIEFLDAFKQLLPRPTLTSPTMALPMIHVHCFSKADDPEKDAVEQIEKVLGCSIKDEIKMVHRVRDVAPKKEMLCVSFRLPRQIAFQPEAKLTSTNAVGR